MTPPAAGSGSAFAPSCGHSLAIRGGVTTAHEYPCQPCRYSR